MANRRTYATEHPVEIALAFTSIVLGLAFFLPSGSVSPTSIQRIMGRFDTLWNLAYLIGGTCLFCGALIPVPRLIAPGLALLSGAFGTNAIAIWWVFGWAGRLSIGIFTAVAAGFCMRVVILIRTARARRPIR
jgi:hypothetical protein